MRKKSFINIHIILAQIFEKVKLLRVTYNGTEENIPEIEYQKIDDLNIKEEYKKGLKTLVIEKSICRSLSNSCAKTLGILLSQMNYWSQRTYEGKRTTLGCPFLIVFLKDLVGCGIMVVEVRKTLSARCGAEGERVWSGMYT